MNVPKMVIHDEYSNTNDLFQPAADKVTSYFDSRQSIKPDDLYAQFEILTIGLSRYDLLSEENQQLAYDLLERVISIESTCQEKQKTELNELAKCWKDCKQIDEAIRTIRQYVLPGEEWPNPHKKVAYITFAARFYHSMRSERQTQLCHLRDLFKLRAEYDVIITPHLQYNKIKKCLDDSLPKASFSSLKHRSPVPKRREGFLKLMKNNFKSGTRSSSSPPPPREIKDKVRTFFNDLFSTYLASAGTLEWQPTGNYPKEKEAYSRILTELTMEWVQGHSKVIPRLDSHSLSEVVEATNRFLTKIKTSLDQKRESGAFLRIKDCPELLASLPTQQEQLSTITTQLTDIVELLAKNEAEHSKLSLLLLALGKKTIVAELMKKLTLFLDPIHLKFVLRRFMEEKLEAPKTAPSPPTNESPPSIANSEEVSKSVKNLVNTIIYSTNPGLCTMIETFCLCQLVNQVLINPTCSFLLSSSRINFTKRVINLTNLLFFSNKQPVLSSQKDISKIADKFDSDIMAVMIRKKINEMPGIDETLSRELSLQFVDLVSNERLLTLWVVEILEAIKNILKGKDAKK